jgi:hypothetical protein
MPDSHVWEEDDVALNVRGAGDQYKNKTVKFIFKTDDASAVSVGDADVKIDKAGKEFTAAGTLKKVKKPSSISGSTFSDLWYRAKYELSVDGKTKKSFTEKVFVYARKITVTAIDATDETKKVKGAKCRLSQMPPPGATGAMYTVVKETDDDGKIEFPLKYASSYVTLEWQRPHVGTWTPGKDKGAEREAKLTYNPKVKLVFPEPDENTSALHRQFVNLATADDKPEQGSKIKIKVAAVKKEEAEAGQKVYLTAKFDAENSKRTGAAKKAGETLELEKDLDDKKEAVFEIDLGVAGGDKCKIMVGAIKGKTDHEITIQNWRKLYYELMAPDLIADSLPAATLPDKSAGYDFAKELNDFKRKVLDKCFIEYEVLRSHKFGDDHIECSVDPEYVQRPKGGRKAVVVSKKWLEKSSDPVAFGAAQNNKIDIRLCDIAVQRAVTANAHKELMTAKTITCQIAATYGMYCFPTQPESGAPTIDVGASKWEVVKDGLDADKHPGFDAKTPKSGKLEEAWIKYKDFFDVVVTFPDDSEPGKLVGAKSATKCPIAISFTVTLPTGAVNGSSTTGRQLMCIKPQAPECNGATLCHELGHNMGMALMPGRNKKPPGMDDPKHVDDGGNYYRNAGATEAAPAEGRRKTGHNGAHCADGIGNKKAAKFDGMDGTCILFGEGGDDDSKNTRKKFCDQCVTYIKARNLEDIVTSFATRADEDC